MYTLIRSISAQKLFTQQLPIVAITIVISELFYKFHSFTLESMAFLATWFVLDLLVQFMQQRLSRKEPLPELVGK